jgi:hypothetical protein
MPATVRPFVARDIAEVGELHRRVFRLSCDLTDEQWARAYREYFSDVFLNPSLCDGAGASLVYERDGRIRGFLGVMTRRMSFNGRPVRMAVCSQFAVDPGERGQAGLRMLKHCFEGPQDLTITDEAGDETRRVWEWCGGERVLPHSMRWIRPLRPVQLGLSMLAQRKSLTLLARAVAADARILDALIGKLAPASLRIPPVRGHRAELDEKTFLSCIREIGGVRALRPQYDGESAGWAFSRAGRPSGGGAVRKFAVKQDDGSTAGWFVYRATRERIAEVLQIAARPESLGDIIDHLLDDAFRNRAVAVSGRVEPALVPILTSRHAFFYRGHYWTLLHSTNPQLRYAIQAGDAFLTRLEGEWCLRFQ